MIKAAYNKTRVVFEAQHDRLILWVPVLIGLGVAWYFHLRNEPPWWSGTLGMMLCMATAFALKRITALRTFFIALALIASGVTLSQYRTHHIHSPALAAPMSY